MIPLPMYEQEELTSLAGLPAYQLLLETFDNELKYLEDSLAVIPVHEATNLLHHYQALRRIRQTLGDAPQNIAQTLHSLRPNQ